MLCICETRRSEDLWRDFSGNREIRAIVAVFISPGRCRRAASPFHSTPLFSPFLLLLHITVASSCQSRRNWLRRVPKILRGTREYEWNHKSIRYLWREKSRLGADMSKDTCFLWKYREYEFNCCHYATVRIGIIVLTQLYVKLFFFYIHINII